MRGWLLIIMLSSFLDIHGQKKIDEAHLKCQYNYVYLSDTLERKIQDDLLILQIGKEKSKCYSYYSNQVDSIFALPDKDAVLSREISRAFSSKTDYPHKRMKTYVYKNYPQGKITVTDGLSLQDYIYEDELNAQDWQISDSIKTILDYPCQKAECTFRGRQWTAWFAPDIPLSDGPWKFGGLPGLIMEVYDKGKQYDFKIIGLQKVEKEPIVFSRTYVGSKKFEKTNRKDFLKAQKRYLMDMSGYIELESGIDLGSDSPQKVMRYDLIERDYK